ncbi:hypothetical protein So717_43360 [Roseobacter cerasinus]|uniref:Uncharacterized protein n=1 Tax=Roseobacter cerasinus TaxID=2602289 RepID=A0A640VWR4_9RHOB|nr:hypothetical protein So717_43360 [Roseobacter cerasinus]
MADTSFTTDSNAYGGKDAFNAASRDKTLMFAAVVIGVVLAVGSSTTLLYLASTTAEDEKPATSIRLQP